MRNRLADVPRTLAARAGRPAPAGAYLRLWRAVVEGRLPAERVGGSWAIDDAHMAVAADILGLPVASAAEAAA